MIVTNLLIFNDERLYSQKYTDNFYLSSLIIYIYVIIFIVLRLKIYLFGIYLFVYYLSISLIGSKFLQCYSVFN